MSRGCYVGALIGSVAVALILAVWWGQHRAELELEAEQRALHRSLAPLQAGASEQAVREFLRDRAGLAVGEQLEPTSPWEREDGAYSLGSSSKRTHRGPMSYTGARTVVVTYFDSDRRLTKLVVKTLPSYR